MGFILAIFYSFVIVYLLNKIHDIYKHPSKYDSIPGFEDYRKSIWYWPPKKDHRKGTPPDNCGMVGGLIFVIIFAWYILSVFLFHQFKAPISEIIFVFNGFNDWGIIYGVAAFFQAFVLSYYIPMFSKKPMAICFNLHAVFRKEDRSTAWKRMTIIAIISFLVIFPLRLLCLYNYGYIMNEEIVYSPLFSFREQVFDFDEIEFSEIAYDDKGNISKYCIRNKSGDELDICHDFYCIDTSYETLFRFLADNFPEEILISSE